MGYIQPQYQNMGICVFPLNQQLSYIFNFGMLRGSNPTSSGTLFLCTGEERNGNCQFPPVIKKNPPNTHTLATAPKTEEIPGEAAHTLETPHEISEAENCPPYRNLIFLFLKPCSSKHGLQIIPRGDGDGGETVPRVLRECSSMVSNFRPRLTG